MITSGTDIQVERGNFTRIHNAILEKIIKAHFSSRECSAVLYLLRMTYGYQTTTAKLSGEQWERGTGIKRQNIMAVVAGLVKRNIVLQDGGGRGRGNVATYKFNKHFDTWDCPTNESPSIHFADEEMNPHQCNLSEENESPSMQENESPSMQCTSGLKKEKKAAAAAAGDESEQIITLARQAYATVGRIAPSTHTEDGRAVIVTSAQLIELYGYPTCVRGLSTLKERNDAMVRKNARNTIRSPVAYLRTILEDEHGIPVSPNGTSSTVDFSIEELL